VTALQAHAQVFLDLLDADSDAPALVALNGQVQKTQLPPYVVVYFRLHTPAGTEAPEKVSLEATSDVLDAWAYCHSVGGNPTAALAVAGRVRAALLGVEPVIAGRICYPIVHDDSQPTNRDETTGTPVYDHVDVYRFTSQPA
jgi:hypothetical protein